MDSAFVVLLVSIGVAVCTALLTISIAEHKLTNSIERKIICHQTACYRLTEIRPHEATP